MRTVNYTDNILDSRDLYLRKCELESLRDAATYAEEVADAAQTDVTLAMQGDGVTEDLQEALDSALADLKDAQDEFSLPEQQELDMLESIENEIDGFMDGVTLINETHFEDYAQEYAADVLGIDTRRNAWPLNCIDWAQAAVQLQSDFSQVEIEGETYYFS